MILVIETIIILSYMLNPWLGLGLMFAYVVWKLLLSRRFNTFYRLLELMIAALPMAYIGIAGPSMHQMFSWYHGLLFLFILNIGIHFSRQVLFSFRIPIAFTTLLLCLLLNLFWARSVLESSVEIVQVLIMLIPLILVHSARCCLPVSRKDVYQLLYVYADVCAATAIAMIVQFIMYYFFHREIGLIRFYGNNRVQFFVLFKGASILPIFMGIGAVFLFTEFLEKKATVKLLFKMGVIFLAATLNTSRTALFSLIVIMALATVEHLLKKPSAKGIFIAMLGFGAFYFAIRYITSMRSNLTGFMDANGRIGTLEDGIHIWNASIKNIILGEGFTGRLWMGITKPHNFIIQTLAHCGIVVTLITMGMLGKYLLDNLENRYRLILLYVILSGMLVTDFYANAFTTVILILVDLYQGACDTDNEHELALQSNKDLKRKEVKKT